jgi:hypothetical protein
MFVFSFAVSRLNFEINVLFRLTLIVTNFKWKLINYSNVSMKSPNTELSKKLKVSF